MKSPTGTSAKSRRNSRAIVDQIEAVVIDERREPLELVPGVRQMKASAGELALRADFPLLPGSHVLVQIGDRHAHDAARKRFEAEVLGCIKRPRGHQVRMRLVDGMIPRELRKAA